MSFGDQLLTVQKTVVSPCSGSSSPRRAVAVIFQLLDTEGNGTVTSQNMRNYLPSGTVLHLQRLESCYKTELIQT